MYYSATQLVYVEAEDWNSPKAYAELYRRDASSLPWQRCSERMPCMLGKSGLAWGRGLHRAPNSCLQKREGDKRAPAGVFSLGKVFGKQAPACIKMEMLLVHPHLEYVDDPDSSYYNKPVDVRNIANKDWRSSENMLRDDDLYDVGLIIAHNEDPICPGAGSCIFLHRWRSKEQGSDGCTTLSKEDVDHIVRWLDPAHSPIIVQGTRDALDLLRSELLLP